MSCVTGSTGITETTFFTQDRRINFLKEFGHEVDKSEIESNRKVSVAVSTNLQYLIDAINNQPSKCEDLEYSHMYHATIMLIMLLILTFLIFTFVVSKIS